MFFLEEILIFRGSVINPLRPSFFNVVHGLEKYGEVRRKAPNLAFSKGGTTSKKHGETVYNTAPKNQNVV